MSASADPSHSDIYVNEDLWQCGVMNSQPTAALALAL